MKTADDVFKNGPLIWIGQATAIARDLASTLNDLPLSVWPMQTSPSCKPAMVNDPAWPFLHGDYLTLHEMTNRLMNSEQVRGWVAGLPGTLDYRTPMLSVVMPGHDIAPHGDRQESDWLGRVHFPITTNPHAMFTLEGVACQLEQGRIYFVDVRKVHSVRNGGLYPRVHLMVDVHSAGSDRAQRASGMLGRAT